MDIQDNQRQASLYAYLAGIIDGEGSIRIGRDARPNKKGFYPAISIGMTNKEVIELIAKTFLKQGIYVENVPRRKTIYRWATSGTKKIPWILEKLYPFLIVKRKQAELIFEFCKYERKSENVRICRECKKNFPIQGYGLCKNCYARNYRHRTLSLYRKNESKPTKCLPIEEIRRRQELYRKIKKLNSVGSGRND